MKEKVRIFLDTDLLEKYLLGTTTAEETARVERYIAMYPEGGCKGRRIFESFRYGAFEIAVQEGVISADDPLMEPRFYISPLIEDWIEAESRKALREHVEARRLEVDLRIVEDVPSDAPVSG